MRTEKQIVSEELKDIKRHLKVMGTKLTADDCTYIALCLGSAVDKAKRDAYEEFVAEMGLK